MLRRAYWHTSRMLLQGFCVARPNTVRFARCGRVPGEGRGVDPNDAGFRCADLCVPVSKL